MAFSSSSFVLDTAPPAPAPAAVTTAEAERQEAIGESRITVGSAIEQSSELS